MRFKKGKFSGNAPSLVPIGPDTYLHIANPEAPLCFIRPSGQIIALDFDFETDIGSIPPWARFRTRLSKGYYSIAYLFHDGEFERKRQGFSHLTFEEANKLCAEIIITLQQDGFKGAAFAGGPLTAKIIYWAISSPIGRRAWNRMQPTT
jgi:hypothetical protein